MLLAFIMAKQRSVLVYVVVKELLRNFIRQPQGTTIPYPSSMHVSLAGETQGTQGGATFS